GAERQVGGKAVGFDEDVDLTAAGSALQVAEDVAAGFAPVAGDTLAIRRHVAGQVELVAVARAVQFLLEAHACAADLITGLAADVLGRAVGERNRSSAGPCSIE